MIGYSGARRLNSEAYTSTITRAVENALGVAYMRPATQQEDFRGIDHWVVGNIYDLDLDFDPTADQHSVQYKVQHSRSFRTWTVQQGMWGYPVDFYAFAHVATRRIYIIDGPTLKMMDRTLYNGPNTNQPFYYGQLDDLVDHGAFIVSFNGEVLA